MLSDAMHVRSMVTLFIKHQDIFIQHPLHGHLRCENGCYIGSISPLTSRGHHIILAITDYFSKRAEAVPLKEVKIPNVIKFIKHHVL